MDTMNHKDIMRAIELDDTPSQEVVPMEKSASASLVDEIRSYTASGMTKEASAQTSLMDVINGLEKSAGISSPYATEFIKRAQAMGATDEQIVRVLEERHHELLDKAAQGFLGGIKNMFGNMVPRVLSKNRATGAAFGKGLEHLQKSQMGASRALGQVLNSLDDAALAVKHTKKPGWLTRMVPGFDYGRHQGDQIGHASNKLYKRLMAAERAGVDKNQLVDIFNRLGGGTKGGIKRLRHPELQAWMKEMKTALDAAAVPPMGQLGVLGQVPGKGMAMVKKHPLATAGLLGAGGYAAGDLGDGDSGAGNKVVVL